MDKDFVPVEVSARHIHLSKEHFSKLFGDEYILNNKKDLSQHGQFACTEKVLLIGQKGEYSLTVLGPLRDETQIELSITDAKRLGINAPLRNSGDIIDSAGAKISGPFGDIKLDYGVIVAKRHLHIGPSDALNRNLVDGQIISIEISGVRNLVLSNVLVRVGIDSNLAFHIDTDEANAACIEGNVFGRMIY